MPPALVRSPLKIGAGCVEDRDAPLAHSHHPDLTVPGEVDRTGLGELPRSLTPPPDRSDEGAFRVEDADLLRLIVEDEDPAPRIDVEGVDAPEQSRSLAHCFTDPQILDHPPRLLRRPERIVGIAHDDLAGRRVSTVPDHSPTASEPEPQAVRRTGRVAARVR